ncbi:hypothetical protein Plec18167_006154 [Paecilomyces lecythidis]|uniref:Uncharacterized protein n=1 Tax=Paecilomyces lecythidis TaxID=3004212 RepID=A0ABR3XD60_9EURO
MFYMSLALVRQWFYLIFTILPALGPQGASNLMEEVRQKVPSIDDHHVWTVADRNQFFDRTDQFEESNRPSASEVSGLNTSLSGMNGVNTRHFDLIPVDIKKQADIEALGSIEEAITESENWGDYLESAVLDDDNNFVASSAEQREGSLGLSKDVAAIGEIGNPWSATSRLSSVSDCWQDQASQRDRQISLNRESGERDEPAKSNPTPEGFFPSTPKEISRCANNSENVFKKPCRGSLTPVKDVTRKATNKMALSTSLTSNQIATRQLLLALVEQQSPSKSRLNLDNIQYYGDRLISEGSAKILDDIDTWTLNRRQYQDILSLPSIDMFSPEATCVSYYSFLTEQLGKDTGCTSVARRVARVIFYLSFERLVMELEERDRSSELEKSRAGRPTSTVARDLILERFYPDNYKDASTDKQVLRNKLSGEIRYGQRWWRYASVVGLDVLLTCPQDIALTMNNHSRLDDPSLDVFINYVANAYPGALVFFRLFAPVTQRLLLTDGLPFSSAMDHIRGSLGQIPVDLSAQCSAEKWQWIDTRSVAARAVAEFWWHQN